MGELKSSWEIALEKAKKLEGDEGISLTPKQREEIAEIRKIYSAKMAEVEILVQDPEKKEMELNRLRRERERKIEAIHEAARKNKKS